MPIVSKILILFLFATPVVFADSEWKLRKDNNGIKIFTRSIEGSDFDSFRGEVTLNTTLSTLMAVHADVAYVKEWLKGCESAELLSEISAEGYYAYFKTDSPWPVKDRDYALKYTINQDATDHSLTLSFTTAVGLVPESDDCVRITKLNGFWKMTPLMAAPNKPQVKVVYQVNADPGGTVPAWLANSFVVDQPYHSLKQLKHRVTLEKYQNQHFSFVKDPARLGTPK